MGQPRVTFAAEYLGYLAPNFDVEEALDATSDGYRRREAPDGWRFRLKRDSITLTEDEEKTISVTVSALTVGKAAFAARVEDKANPNNFVVSPIVAVEQTWRASNKTKKTIGKSTSEANQYDGGRQRASSVPRHRPRIELTEREGLAMSDELVLELHLALVPESGLASKQAELSHKMAQGKPALLELTGIEPVLAFAPHLTIYQFPLKLTDVPQLYNELPSIAGRYSAFTLKATEYASHDDGPFEVRYQAAKRLMDLQADVLAKANPLRGDLLMDRDPAGHKLSDLARQSGTVGDNIRNTGFDAVGDPAKGGTFKPHVTINVFAPGTTIDLSSTDLPAIDEFSGSFDALGFYLMGPYGTCAQRLGNFNFS